jgi:hypothetical protein
LGERRGRHRLVEALPLQKSPKRHPPSDFQTPLFFGPPRPAFPFCGTAMIWCLFFQSDRNQSANETFLTSLFGNQKKLKPPKNERNSEFPVGILARRENAARFLLRKA